MTISNQRSSSDASNSARGKRGCLLLILTAVLFGIAVFGVLIYVMSRTPTEQQKANERATILACQQRIDDPQTAPRDRAAAREGCAEMARQFQRKYQEAP